MSERYAGQLVVAMKIGFRNYHGAVSGPKQGDGVGVER